MRVPTSTSSGLVLDVVRERGEVSRVELAEITGLTQATISTTVRSLLDQGLLTETDRREFTGGKPRVKLSLNPLARCAVGVQLGADSVVICVVDASGAIVARTRIPGVKEDPPPATILRIGKTIKRVLERTGLHPEVVLGVGLALPGLIDIERGVILQSRSLHGWQGFKVAQAVAEETGFDVLIDTNASAAAIGEFWGGGIPASRAQCTIFMGESIGAGIVLDGSLYRGASGNVGAIGQLRGVSRKPVWHNSPNLEDLAGPLAVARNARAALSHGRTSVVSLSPVPLDPFADFESVAAEAIIGDPLAVALVEESAEHLASAVVGIANLLDLDLVVLAGPSFSIAGSIYLKIIQKRLDEDFYASARHPITVRLSAQIFDAAAVGSAAMVLQKGLAPR